MSINEIPKLHHVNFDANLPYKKPRFEKSLPEAGEFQPEAGEIQPEPKEAVPREPEEAVPREPEEAVPPEPARKQFHPRP